MTRLRTLAYAAIFYAVGIGIHTADHLRRGISAVTPEVFWAGNVSTVFAIVAIALVLAKHPFGPVLAVAAGIGNAIGVAGVHLLPRWSAFSDAFPGGRVDGWSWCAVVLEIVGALWFGISGLRAGAFAPEINP